jgi:hypothetical protein
VDAAAQVAQIVRAAGESAGQLRAEAERRARERIAEADRAAGYRVAAAEEEATEILAAARAEADRLSGQAAVAHAEAARVREAAEAERTSLLAEALATAEAEADKLRAAAREEARATTSEARLAAREVLDDGTGLSTDLRDLSSSLRTNAERLLRDIRLAHAAMTARLDQAAPGAPLESDPRPRRGGRSDEGDLDVPEFMPGR